MTDSTEPPPLTEREMAELRSMYGVYQVNRAIERLRWLERELAQRTAEVAKAEAERDEARREYCEARADLRSLRPPTSPKVIAANRGWDCFDAKDGGAA
jgi:hypothetical protein